MAYNKSRPTGRLSPSIKPRRMRKPAQFEIGPNVWTRLTRRRKPRKQKTSCYEYPFIIASSSRPVEPLRARDGKQSFESIRQTAWRRIFPAPHYQHYQLLKISLSFIFLSLISYSYSYSISIERCAHNVHTSFAHCDVFWNKYTYICRKPPIWAAFIMLPKSQILCTSRDKSHISCR